MPPVLLVFLGGGAGAVARYGSGLLATRWLGATWPYGTLGVNLIGAFLIGLIVQVLALKFSAPEPLRLLLVTGFLGGYTTFSAFALETTAMLQRGEVAPAALYVALSVLGTVALVLLGQWLGQMAA